MGLSLPVVSYIDHCMLSKSAFWQKNDIGTRSVKTMKCLRLEQGILKGKYHWTIDLLFDWFGTSCMTNDNFCFYLQNRQIQTSQTGGQRYSDISPLVFPGYRMSSQPNYLQKNLKKMTFDPSSFRTFGWNFLHLSYLRGTYLRNNISETPISQKHASQGLVHQTRVSDMHSSEPHQTRISIMHIKDTYLRDM